MSGEGSRKRSSKQRGPEDSFIVDLADPSTDTSHFPSLYTSRSETREKRGSRREVRVGNRRPLHELVGYVYGTVVVGGRPREP